jgi:hypothetical protein
MKYFAITIYLVAIISLTICVTADENPSGNNPISIDNQKGLESRGLNQNIAGPITGSKRAEMLVPFSKVSKDDFVIDVSEGSTQYIDGAVSIPYMNFLQDKKPRSKEEISRILRDAGVPCDRPIYIYGECLPCGPKSKPAAFAYLILESLGYQVRLLDGNLEQWRASGRPISDKPANKPKTNCTPLVKTNNSGGSNQIRMAAGNGSITEGVFDGSLTSIIVNSNETVSEEITRTFKANPIGVIRENVTIMPDGTVLHNDAERERYYREMNKREIEKWEKIRDGAFRDFISQAAKINFFKIDLIDISEFKESMEKFQNNPRFIYTEHEARLELDPLYKFQYSLSRLQILYSEFKNDNEKPGKDTRALAAPTTPMQEIPKPKPLRQNDHPIPSIKPEE